MPLYTALKYPARSDIPIPFISFHILATSALQPQPAGTPSPSARIPEASQIRITTSLTALTSSTVAPLFTAPFKWPFNCGLT